ncbi:MAG: nucleotidyl transferase AbiEii/AbiGii toxin family protein [Patescibacteria group bacterium]
MGEIPDLTKEQQIILDEVKENAFCKENFYFTGGTALSAVYLHHRESDDIDLFSEKKFDNQILFTLMTEWSNKQQFQFQSQFVEVMYIYQLVFSNKNELKVDFAYYPYTRLEKGQLLDGVKVDSLTDIAVNKLLTITQRDEVKDFVDLYFLLQKFSIWDLIEGVRIKFKVKLEPFLLSADFLKVEDFVYLPKMIKPLSLEELKSFFREKAKEVGRKEVM